MQVHPLAIPGGKEIPLDVAEARLHRDVLDEYRVSGGGGWGGRRGRGNDSVPTQRRDGALVQASPTAAGPRAQIMTRSSRSSGIAFVSRFMFCTHMNRFAPTGPWSRQVPRPREPPSAHAPRLVPPFRARGMPRTSRSRGGGRGSSRRPPRRARGAQVQIQRTICVLSERIVEEVRAPAAPGLQSEALGCFSSPGSVVLSCLVLSFLVL